MTPGGELPDGSQFMVNGGTLRIQFWSPEIVRVTYASATENPAVKSLTAVANPEAVKFKQQENHQLNNLGTGIHIAFTQTSSKI